MTGRGRTVGEARILALVTLGVLVTSASITILSVSLPVVVGYFRASALQSTWLLLIPFVVTTALLVPLGRVADTVGQRTMFLAGMSLFTVCTAGSGLAWSMGALLVLAVLQAIGAAMVLCVTGAIIGAVFAGSRLGWAMGVYLAGLSVSQVIAPIAGGLVAEGLGWRWVFWIQVPLAVLCLPLGSRFLRELPSRPGRRRSRADVVGGLVLVAAVGALVVALTAVQESGPADLRVIVAAVVFIALVPVLAVVEGRASDPILPLNLLRRRSFLFANLANMVSTLPRFVPVTAVALYLQAVVGETAFVAGLKLAPLPVAMTAGSLVAAPIASRTSLPSAGILGSALMAAGLGLLVASVELGWPYGADLAAFGALGLGAGIFGTVVSTLIVRVAPAADLGTVNGLRLTLMILGEACAMAGGLAILTSPLPAAARSDFYQARLAGSLTEAVVDGFVALSVVMIVASLAGGAALLAAESGQTATRSGDKFMHSSTTKE